MRPPDFVVGGEDNPYLLRWRLFRLPWLNLYLHEFRRDDEDRALHDHPWWFFSLILSGGYSEITPAGTVERGRFSLAFRPATHRHRVVLRRDAEGRPIPCRTLVITGPRVREWGFWCPRGFVSWKVFTKPGAPGEVGRGCE